MEQHSETSGNIPLPRDDRSAGERPEPMRRVDDSPWQTGAFYHSYETRTHTLNLFKPEAMKGQETVFDTAEEFIEHHDFRGGKDVDAFTR